MDRKSIISMSEIKRIFSASDRIKIERYNDNLNNLQENYKKRPCQYNLNKIDFNVNSRVAHIEILQSQEYRTIQKYITRNYNKYPIYSDWKIKEKKIKKKLKLTNSTLELLNNNNDNLIKMFAEEIIISLNNEELFPSWFIKIYLKKIMDYDLQNIKSEINLFTDSQNNKIDAEQARINKFKDQITEYQKTQKKQEIKKNKISLKLVKLLNAKTNILKSIMTLGIFNYLISNKRTNKISLKLSTCNKFLTELSEKIADNNNHIDKCNISIKNYKCNINKKKEDYENKKRMIVNIYNEKLSNVVPLSNIIRQDENFTMLKLFNGLSYEKIIGVYVIHNIEKDKYYVGQSKDVMKRIKQHFNGTIPKNIIFAEDYYTSTMQNRDDIFELKIIRCKSKDELDSLEKKLIYEYDSCNNGYNGTSGNI